MWGVGGLRAVRASTVAVVRSGNFLAGFLRVRMHISDM